jgi:hypothetical protein
MKPEERKLDSVETVLRVPCGELKDQCSSSEDVRARLLIVRNYYVEEV